MASEYNYGVAVDGTSQWRSESMYDRKTSAPKIIAVFATESDAQTWIAEQENIDRAIKIMPGSGERRIFGIYDLSQPEAYLSRQDVGRQAIKIGLKKKELLADVLGYAE